MFSRLMRAFVRDRQSQPAPATAPRDGAETAQWLIEQGHVAEARGELSEAERLYRAAIVVDANSADAHMNLGNALSAKGQVPGAVQSYERAIAINPDHAKAHYNLGLALLDSDADVRVERHFRTALRLREAFPEAWMGLALVLEAQGDLEGAAESYRRALVIKPDYLEAQVNLGLLYKQHGLLEAAIDCYRKALLIRPDHAESLGDLGNVLQEQGEIDAAIETYQRALILNPDHVGGYGNLLFTLNYHPDKSAEEIFEAYRAFDERFGLPHRGTWRDHSNDRDTTRRLRVGYVSPDFCHHPVRHFLEPLLEHHNKNTVEVYAYAVLAKEDAVTSRYRGYADHWIPTVGLSDAALAERIRADGVDILVDLAGHTAYNRLGVFARRPAPVSVSWLGYGYTTGLSAVDYLLTDSTSAPQGSEHLFSEQPWRLATPGYVYRPAEGMGPVSELPAAQRGYVTFGTLTRSVRLNHRSIRVWAEILNRVEDARLVVDSKNYLDAAMRATLAEKFARHGIARERLELGFHSPPWDLLRGLDIGLDCFPHNSGTTLFETLYMGLPYVTLAGRPSVGRLGSSILEGFGHPEWVAHSEEEYIEKAVALASDWTRLAMLRGGLRAEMEASPLMDGAGFARKVEVAYREMFTTWVAAHD